MTNSRSLPRTLVLLGLLASVGCTGPKGAPGPTGPSGAPGALGPQGQIGAPGVKGVQSVSQAAPSADRVQLNTEKADVSSTHGDFSGPKTSPSPDAKQIQLTFPVGKAAAVAGAPVPPPPPAQKQSIARDAQVAAPAPAVTQFTLQLQPAVSNTASSTPSSTTNQAPATDTAGDCATVQVDEDYMGLPRNQGEMGLCYAYSAADMLTYCLNSGKQKTTAEWALDNDSKAYVSNSDKSRVDYTKQLVKRSDLHDIDGFEAPDLTLNQRVSALDLGLNYDFKNASMADGSTSAGAVENGGGDPRFAINAIKGKNGACMESRLTSDAFAYDQLLEELHLDPINNGSQDIHTTVALINKIVGFKVLYDTLKQHNYGDILACSEEAKKFPNLDTALTDKDTLACTTTKGTGPGQIDEPRFHHLSLLSDMLKEAPGMDPNRTFPSEMFKNDQFLNVLKTSATSKDVLAAIDNNFCDGHRLALPSSCTEVDELIAKYNGGTAPLLAKIDSRLSAKTPLPVGIGVYAHPLHATTSDPGALTPQPGGTLESEGGHAMVITGRRFRNNVCEYRVRNSWGRSCFEQYSNGKNSKDPNYPLYGSYVSCDETDHGYIYISRSVLQQILTSVSWIGS